jgi:hypothetical protein
MAGVIKTLAVADGVAIGALSTANGFKEVGTGDYTANVWTVTDTDGYGVYALTTSSTARTLQLPTLADNIGRYVTCVKADSGSGYVLVDGEGAETVNGVAGFYLTAQYESATFLALSTGWLLVSFLPRGNTLAACSASVTGVTDNYDEVTGCSMTLQPGTWRIGYHLSGRFAATTAVGAIATAMISTAASHAVNVTTGVVTDTTQSAEWTSPAAATGHGPINLSCSTIVTPTSATTYKLFFRTSNDSTVTAIVRPATFSGGLTDPDGGTVLWAQRFG